MQTQANPQPSPAELKKEVLLASLGVLVGLTALKHGAAYIPFLKNYAFTISAGLQLYLPLWLVGRRGITMEGLGLSRDHLSGELKVFLLLALLTIPLFGLGHHLWQTAWLGRFFEFRWPSNMWQRIPTEILVVGLAEELFFRGYLQGRMQQLWPARRKLFGAPFGLAILVASAVFALAHFVGEYSFVRLGPFFPALLFGLLRARRGSIIAAVLYHAFCNLLADVLWVSYHLPT